MKAEAERRMQPGRPSENFSKGRAADKASAFTGYQPAHARQGRGGRRRRRGRAGEISASWSRTWIAPAGSMGRTTASRWRCRPRSSAPSRRRFRAGPIASSPLIRRGRTKCGRKTRRTGRRILIRRCRSRRSAPCRWRRSRTPIRSSGSGRRTITCGRRSPWSTLGALSSERSSRGPRIAWARATGCAGKPSIASWRCAASPTVVLTTQTTLLRGAMRANSEKPEEFYELVESLCPAPRYLELFARKTRPGWDVWGDEVPRHPLIPEFRYVAACRRRGPPSRRLDAVRGPHRHAPRRICGADESPGRCRRRPRGAGFPQAPGSIKAGGGEPRKFCAWGGGTAWGPRTDILFPTNFHLKGPEML